MECEDQGLYWKVNEEDNSLAATEDLHDASFFHVIPNEDTDDDPYDFYIAWERTAEIVTMSRRGSIMKRKPSTERQNKIEPVLRYLQVTEGNQDSKVGC